MKGDTPGNIEAILKLTAPLTDPVASPAILYLERRGLDPKVLTQNLRYHRAVEYFDRDGKLIGVFPALIGVCRTTTSDGVIALLRIYLTENGEKASVEEPKKILGPLNGSFILFDHWAEEMNIGEGIETMLAVRQTTLRPTISAINASNLVHFEPPDKVKVVRIWCDLDRSGTGQKYAALLARRLFERRIIVHVHTPAREIPENKKGVDWLDELVESGPESIFREFEASKPYQPQNEDENLVCMASVATEPVEWLWPPYIPKGKVTFLEGDPGLGKSFISLGLATAISRGEMLSDKSGRLPHGNVVLFCTEDGLGDTIRPRLEAMQGNLDRIHAYKIPIVLNDEGKVAIENAARYTTPQLIVLDPLSAFLSGDSDINKANHARQFMSWLAEAARKYNCAILIVRHITKGARDQAIYRGLGSIDFTAAARSVLLVGCDPDDKSNRAIFHTKSNLAPFGDPVGFAIKDGTLEWTGPSTLSIEKIFQGYKSAEETISGNSAVKDAEAFLRSSLANGKRLADEVKDAADQECITARTLGRAKKVLRVKSVKDPTPGGKWYWELPSEYENSGASYYETDGE